MLTFARETTPPKNRKPEAAKRASSKSHTGRRNIDLLGRLFGVYDVHKTYTRTRGDAFYVQMAFGGQHGEPSIALSEFLTTIYCPFIAPVFFVTSQWKTLL